MIEINIQKRIRRHDGSSILQVQTSFEVCQITQISGPSGAGKTTLLKIIAGLVKPDQGKISFNEEVWADSSEGILLPPQKRGVGMVFQNYALFPNMTVLEHLQFGSHDKSYIDTLLEIGELGQFQKHRPVQLSGGQQQRLALLRALSTRPRLLLMDEPFSALNHSLMLKLMADLKLLFKQLQTTCLLVSHQHANYDFADQIHPLD